MHWIRRNLRGNAVIVKANPDGSPAAGADGRVDIVYRLAPGAKVYRASARNLEPTGNADDDHVFESNVDVGGEAPAPTTSSSNKSSSSKSTAKKKSKSAPATVSIPEDAIVIWTDGACSGNPGPAGIGAVIIDGDDRRELSEYLGSGTNNIAELTAILRALQEVADEDRERPVFVHSDSSYSLGLLTKNWKAKANQELVAELRAEAKRFPKLTFVKVKGHAGIPENERADELATGAISNR